MSNKKTYATSTTISNDTMQARHVHAADDTAYAKAGLATALIATAGVIALAAGAIIGAVRSL